MLSRRAGELVVQLLERREPTITADFLDERLPGERQALLNAGAFEPRPYRRSVILSDDDGLSFRQLDWQPETSSRGYFDAADGNVTVASIAQEVLAVSLPWWLRWLGDAVGLGVMGKPDELVPGHAWDLGEIWISRQRKIPILFVRRLHLPLIRCSLIEALEKRSGRSGGLLLTSSRNEVQTAEMLPSVAVRGIRGVLTNSPDVFAIDLDLLLSPFTAPTAAAPMPPEPLALSPDGRRLVINGETNLAFSGEIQVSIIRQLVAAHRAGRRVAAVELLDQAKSQAGSLRRAFGSDRWNRLKHHLKSDGGLWGFDA